MIIDNKGKLFGKISIIDILVVLILVGGVAGIGYKYAKAKVNSPFTKGDTIITQFYYDEISDYAANDIKVGDMVTDRATSSNFGKVTKVEVNPSNSYASDDKGKWVKSPKEGYNSVIVTVEGPGVYKDGTNAQGVGFGGIDYYVYKSVEVQIGNTTFWAKVYSLKKKG